MEQTNWLPEHCDALRRHVAEGLAFSAIARVINLKFNTAYTRSAAIGRARRMGLLGCDRPEFLLRVVPLRSEPAVKSQSATGSAELPWARPVLKTQPLSELRCVDVEPRHLTLMELECGDCRYPYGGDEEGETITFCGRRCQPGSSYCAPHFQLSRIPIASPEREAIDREIWLRIVETA